MQRPKAEDAWNVYDYTLVTLSVADVVACRLQRPEHAKASVA